MAGKFANFIAYQSRHLDAADFAAWLKAQRDVNLAAGNAGAVRTIDRFTGMSQVERALDQLQRNVLSKVIKPALTKASDALAGIEKASVAHDRTGTLRQSIGSSKVRLYPATFCGYVASGPRRGYGRTILARMTTRGLRLKRQSKKFTEANPQISTFANPVKYAHFLMTGRKASVAGAGKAGKSGKRALVDSFSGRFLGHSVRPAPPKDFMAPAARSVDAAANVFNAEANLRIGEITSQ